jgi:cation transport protein ChaC
MTGAPRYRAQALALTEELVARVTQPMPDPGLDPTLTYRTEDEFVALADALLAGQPPDEDLWIFACGSLIWRPACTVNESVRATLHGWHRVFCMKITRWRATKLQPGLMMALDRGGRCNGVACRVPAAEKREALTLLLKREMSLRPSNNMARWVVTLTSAGPRRAIAFVMDRRSPNYIGRLPPEEEATLLASACGHGGSCAEYLHKTIVHLARYGIHDRNLWRLQALVAARIAADAQRQDGVQPVQPKV